MEVVQGRFVEEMGEEKGRVLRVGLICGGPFAERGIALNLARSVLDHIQGGEPEWCSNSCGSAGPEPIPFISLKSYAEESLLFHEKPAEVGDCGCHACGGFKERTHCSVVRESL